MELRDIEIFLTLAEELHFGRTAEKLRLTQARVSQVIKKMERRVGAGLFDRSSRHVALTPLGEQLRDDLAIGYRLIRQGVDAAAEVARGHSGTLALGLFLDHAHEITETLDLFRRRYPHCELRFREITFNDPFGALRAGRIDLAAVWLPIHEPDLTTGPVLYAEPLVLAVSADHELAKRESVTMEDLADLTVPSLENPDHSDDWYFAHTPRTTPSGRPIHRGAGFATIEEVLAAIRADEIVSPVGAIQVKTHQRPGVVYVPITDSHLLRYALVWRSGAEAPLIRAFVDTVRDAREGKR
ncbi:MAG: LysR family transcriptional regulator [Stackebrandtia sp.]